VGDNNQGIIGLIEKLQNELEGKNAKPEERNEVEATLRGRVMELLAERELRVAEAHSANGVAITRITELKKEFEKETSKFKMWNPTINAYMTNSLQGFEEATGTEWNSRQPFSPELRTSRRSLKKKSVAIKKRNLPPLENTQSDNKDEDSATPGKEINSDNKEEEFVTPGKDTNSGNKEK